MGAKKEKKATKENLSLDATESEPSVPAKKVATKKVDDFEPPKDWGPKGEGGYLIFQRDFINAKKESQADENFDRKAAVADASDAWKNMSA